MRSRVFLHLVCWTCLVAAAGAAPDPDLRFVLILSRHGVRSPLVKNEEAAKYSTDPWPQWEVPPGYLTPHGQEQMRLMGAYYRAYYADRGLLSGNPSEDAQRIFIRADADERTILSAQALAEGLVPGESPRLHALPEGARGDPIFHSVTAHLGHPDHELAAAAVLGRVGGDLGRVIDANRPLYESLERVLAGPGGLPEGKISVVDDHASVAPGTDYDLVQFKGPAVFGVRLVDSLLLEYCDGKPMADVGWGRLTPDRLSQILALASNGFDLGHRTFAVAQVEGSNLASHILATLQQAALRQPVDGALGAPEDRLAVLVGHDTNIASMSGLLGLDWRLPGSQPDPTFPGGAMVFELRGGADGGPATVRVRYVSESLDQIREGAPLTRQNPPEVAPIFVPGCSGAAPDFEAPLDQFAARLKNAIDPSFTAPEPEGVR